MVLALGIGINADTNLVIRMAQAGNGLSGVKGNVTEAEDKLVEMVESTFTEFLEDISMDTSTSIHKIGGYYSFAGEDHKFGE